MVTVRKKLNKSAIILLGLLLVGAIVGTVCHFVGVINLSFIGDYAIMGATWAAQSGWNVAIAGGVIFAAGMGLFWWMKDYIIGTEMPVASPMVGSGYNPVPTTPSTPQQNNEVSIS